MHAVVQPIFEALVVFAWCVVVGVVADAEEHAPTEQKSTSVALAVDEDGRATLTLSRLDASLDLSSPDRRCRRLTADGGEATYTYFFSDPNALTYLSHGLGRQANVSLNPSTRRLRMQPAKLPGEVLPRAMLQMPYRASLPLVMGAVFTVPEAGDGPGGLMIKLTPLNLNNQSMAAQDILITVLSDNMFSSTAVCFAVARFSQAAKEPVSNLLEETEIAMSSEGGQCVFTVPLPEGATRNAYGVSLEAIGATPIEVACVQLRTNPIPVVGIQFQQAGEFVVVTSLADASPAKAAGIQAGDFVLNVNGKKISKPEEAIDAIASTPLGGEAKLELERRGSPLALSVPVQEPHQPPELAKGDEVEAFDLNLAQAKSGPADRLDGTARSSANTTEPSQSVAAFPAAAVAVGPAEATPWALESATGLDDSGRAIDRASAAALGEESRAFLERSFRGIKLGEKYKAAPEGQKSDPWLLPIADPKAEDAGREATVRVLVENESQRVVGIFAVYRRQPLIGMAEDLRRTFGQTTQELAVRHLKMMGLDLEEATIKYTFPQVIVRVSGHKFETRIIVLDRDYVERSLRPFANAVLSACRWAKQNVDYGREFSGEPLPKIGLADLKREFYGDGHNVLLWDAKSHDVALKLQAKQSERLPGWDVAVAWSNEKSRGGVVNLGLSRSIGSPLLTTTDEGYVVPQLACVGVCTDLFHDVANFLVQQEFPPSGDKIRVLNPNGVLNPWWVFGTDHDPAEDKGDAFLGRRAENVAWGGGSDMRAYRWMDEEGCEITISEGYVLGVTRSAPSGL
jgi:hypothetical protein